jgi:pteridine reductase
VGAAIVRTLHQHGWQVWFSYLTSTQEAQALCDELNAQRANSCRIFRLVLDDPHTLEHGLDTIRQALTEHNPQGLNLLVNNASTFASSNILNTDAATLLHHFQVNAATPFLVARGLLPMLQQAGGNIVNLVDIHAEQPLKDYAAYSISKSAMLGVTRALALELAPQVRVNGVSPGPIIWPEQDAGYWNDTVRDTVLKRIPLQREGTPQDIADAVYYLASAHYVTGHIIPVDGGRMINP